MRVLKKASPRLRKAIIDNSENDLILALCEIISNVLTGNVQLNPNQKKKLNVHKKSLRLLANRSVPIKTKRKLLQKGGFLAALLPPALSLLATIVGNAIN